jgi:hypothetical protein
LLGIYLVDFGGPDPCKPRTRSLHFQRKIAALFHGVPTSDARQMGFFYSPPTPVRLKKAKIAVFFPVNRSALRRDWFEHRCMHRHCSILKPTIHWISRRMQFVVIDEQGKTVDAGPAPYLDFRSLKPDETEAAHKLLEAGWLKGDIEKMAMHFAIAHLVPEHLRETRERRLAEIDRVEGEVRARLKHEINYWDGRAEELALKEQAGKGGRLNSGNARAYAHADGAAGPPPGQLMEERDIQALPPLVKGAALVVPSACCIAVARQCQRASTKMRSPAKKLSYWRWRPS